MSEVPEYRRMSKGDFDRIAEVARTDAGIVLPDSKLGMVQSRIFRHMRRNKFKSGISEYIDVVLSDDEHRRGLISILTTNVTGFFREAHHFASLSDQFLKNERPEGSRIRIWSAGCSAGHEPYSISMTLRDVWPDPGRIDLRILATDIDSEVLEVARAGIYPLDEVSKIGDHQQKRFFEAAQLDGRPAMKVKSAIAAPVAFRQLNLHTDWPMKGKFDAIFCRNVVIYFSEEHRAALWKRFHDVLHPGGLLFIGHSERIHPLQGSGFEPAGITTFRKKTAT